jgi:muramoyltetrapeptide carboxypeptidase
MLDRIDWKGLARSVAKGTRWVGHSDITTLHMGLLAHTKVSGNVGWAGPLAVEDFGRDVVDDVTQACFLEAMSGELEAIGFRTEAGFDGLSVAGTLWGGNLSMVCSMLGTRHWPNVRGGVLFLEDVNEHPYRVERCLLQLHQAGVLGAQKAVVLGAFSNYKKSPLDRGFTLQSAVQHLRSISKVPILTGLPFGHVPTKVSLPVGARVKMLVDGRNVLIGW